MEKDIKASIEEFLKEKGVKARFLTFNKAVSPQTVLTTGEVKQVNPFEALKQKKAEEDHFDW